MQLSDKKYMFEEMPVSQAIRTMAVPTIISQLINLVYNIVDTFYIGRTGNPYMIAAVSFSFTLFVMNIAISNMFGNGGGSQMARLTGQGENERAKSVSSFAFYGAIAVALLYSLLVFVFLEKLLYLCGASEQTIGFAKQYVIVTVCIGGLPTILSIAMAHLLRNSGNAKKASFGLSLGGILNIVFDPVFMFVVFPSGYEVLGAALATCLSNFVSAVYLFVAYVKTSRESNLAYKLSQALSITKEDRSILFSVGVPSGLLTAFFDIANMFLNALMSGFGDYTLAAIGIVLKVERLPNAFCMGLTQGTLPIIAYNYSSGNHERMNKVISTARKYGLCICVCTITLMMLFAKPVISLFINQNGTDPTGALTTFGVAVVFLKLRCWHAPASFLNYQSSFSMQAMGDGRDTFIHAFVREFVVYIPLMYLLRALFGVNGLAFAIVISESIGGLFAVFLLKRFIGKSAKQLAD